MSEWVNDCGEKKVIENILGGLTTTMAIWNLLMYIKLAISGLVFLQQQQQKKTFWKWNSLDYILQLLA